MSRLRYKGGPGIVFTDVRTNIRILNGIGIIFPGRVFDDAQKRSGVFQIQGEGKAWSEGVDSENGNYDFLLCNDIDLDHPEVVSELNRWGKWVSNELNLDGMRLDAIKHMKDQFVAQFLDAVRSERGNDFFMP